MTRSEAPEIEAVEVLACTIPTDEPESDGTLEWDSTTIVIVEIISSGSTGLGYTYGPRAVADVIRGELAPALMRNSAFDVRAHWAAMTRQLRNAGRRGIGSMAISAVDSALWDLKARLLELPLVSLLGGVRQRVDVYGSGGFTSYSREQIGAQFEEWGDHGIQRFKMKVGRSPEDDAERVGFVRGVIGAAAELFVDANGAYDVRQALAFSEVFARHGVTWFEEPVPSDDVNGLRLLRQRGPPGMEIAAGEYASVLHDFRTLLDAGAVDVLMPDMTRCGGVTGLLDAAVLARAHHTPLSAHTAPALHLHPCCAIPEMRHLEYFHDHVRIEALLFEGVPEVQQGALSPDLSRPGNGLALRRSIAQRFAV